MVCDSEQKAACYKGTLYVSESNIDVLRAENPYNKTVNTQLIPK